MDLGAVAPIGNVDDEFSASQAIDRYRRRCRCRIWRAGRAQTLKKEPEANQLSCGQKVLVENKTCPAGQILEVTGSCLSAIPAIDMVRMPGGMQYHCIKRIPD